MYPRFGKIKERCVGRYGINAAQVLGESDLGGTGRAAKAGDFGKDIGAYPGPGTDSAQGRFR
jgi:hypothetical protein